MTFTNRARTQLNIISQFWKHTFRGFVSITELKDREKNIPMQILDEGPRNRWNLAGHWERCSLCSEGEDEKWTTAMKFYPIETFEVIISDNEI